MTKITQFTKSNLPALRTAIDAALKAVGDAHGIELRAGNCTFDSVKVTFKLEGKVLDAKVNEQKEKSDFLAYCGLFNLRPEDFGTIFTSTISGGRTETLTLVGFELKRRKFPIKCRKVDGSIILLTEMVTDRIRNATDAAKKAA